MVYQNRTYLDYNATAPILEEVLEEIRTGAWPMGNPSSVHTCGKKAKRKMGEVKSYLYDLFQLGEREYELFFHSGATEGINSLIKSKAFESFEKNRHFVFLYALSDHSCVVNQIDYIQSLGLKSHALAVDHHGQIQWEQIADVLEGMNLDQTDILLNWTWVNNETGVVNSLDQLSLIKEKFPVMIHVDAVQSIGKIREFNQLNSIADAYTFSAHKFGALKGIGFSFVKPHFMKALMNGGGQQDKLRSGTENTWGIFSIQTALEVMKERYQFDEQNEAKLYIEERLRQLIGDKGHIAGEGAPQRNGNTLYFILNDIKAQTVSMALDMGGMDVSNGSACSSGAVIPSRVLMAMGYSEDQAISAIRLSFSAFFKKEEAIELWPRLESVLKRFVS